MEGSKMADEGDKKIKMANKILRDSDSDEEEGTLGSGAASRKVTDHSVVENEETEDKDEGVEGGRESKLREMFGDSDSEEEEKGLPISSSPVNSVPTPKTTSTSTTHKLSEKGEENAERDAESKRKLQELFGESSSSEDDGSGSEDDDDGQKKGSKITNIKRGGNGVKRLRKKRGESSSLKRIPKKHAKGRSKNESDDVVVPQNRDDDDFIDNEDDDKELLAEYNGDAPPPGSDSEAEEDNTKEHVGSKGTAMMDEILRSMRPSTAQVLSQTARETLAQDLLQTMDAAAMDDELALEEGRQALQKIKLLSHVQRALSKQNLIETLLEFDLLAVLKRWIQPYRNGALPSVTVRSAVYSFLLAIPAQLDHLKRSGVGIAVLRLINHPDETEQHKKVLKQIIDKWNRPIFQRDMDYKAIGQMSMHLGADETPFEQQVSPKRPRHQYSDKVTKSVQNVLGQRQQKSTSGKGKDGAFSSQNRARIPVSSGLSFQKAPRSRVHTAMGSTGVVDAGSRTAIGSKAALRKKMKARS